MNGKTILRNYEKYRDKAKLTDKDVSELSGVSRSTFSDWKSETRNSTPKLEKLMKIAKVLNVSLDDLLKGADKN